MLIPPKNDIEYSRNRLISILASRRLIFNPYSVSDKSLLKIVYNASWGNEFNITQAVVMNFTRLRSFDNWRKFDGIYARVGNSCDEVLTYSTQYVYIWNNCKRYHKSRKVYSG